MATGKQPQRRRGGRRGAPVKPGWRAAKETSTHHGDHPGFVPTHTERRFVQAMAGLRMSADEICAVIGSGRNGEDTGKPISKATLYRHFRNELANGRAMLKGRVAGKFYAALDDDAPWAIQMAMRNQFGWDNGRSGFHVNLLDEGGATGIQGPAPKMQIEFVMPSERELEDQPRDVTPPQIKPDERRDYEAKPAPVTLDLQPARDEPVRSPGRRVPTGRKRGWDWS
jgi:hypothetical protein